MSSPSHSAREMQTRLREITGPAGVVTGAEEMAPYLSDWRGAYTGRAVAVARPAGTDETAAVVRLCRETRTAIVPQGGNTGMCGGATPDAGGGAVVLAMGRMNRIVELDALNNTVTVEAGCVLARIQEAAAEANRLFPLSLGAEGSCQIGGNLSTNAGGVNVLRYGNARDLVLGLEAVLPNGRVWNGLRRLRKDNTGYDLKHLFIGAEGTLGVITQAVLKLFPRPAHRVTAVAAMHQADSAIELLARLRERCGDRVSAFELISRSCLELVFRHIAGARDPLPQAYPWYVLAEFGDTGQKSFMRAELERALLDAIEQHVVSDAAIAETLTQARQVWRLRESIPEATRAEGPAFRSDIAVAVSQIPEFIAAGSRALEERYPGVRIICFGHVGDGNLHFNVVLPAEDRQDKRQDDRAARTTEAEIKRIVHDVVHRFGGSLSAEHGIGQAKRGELARYKSDVELELMRVIKQALDPDGLMNPGKML